MTCCLPGGTPYSLPINANIEYNVEKAKALLDEAGHGKGLNVKLFTTQREKMLTEAIATLWKRIGVQAEIVMYETGTIAEAWRTRALPDGIRVSRHWISPYGMQTYFLNDRTYTNMVDDKLDKLTREMMTHPRGPGMFDFIKNNMAEFVHDLIPCIEVASAAILHPVRKELGVDEWVKYGMREWSYGPNAEYIKPWR
jgi:ABC-type transport system substrate-binding protein